MADPWDWQDDGFKLDGESPLEITRCLWDELAHNEEDSRSLFSTPLADISAQDPPFYAVRGQADGDSLAQRFSNSSLQGGGNSPRMKRRRLLFGEADPIYDHCDPQLESDGVIESFTNCIDPMTQVCSSDLLLQEQQQQQQQAMDVNSLQPDSFWYRHCDEVPAPFGGVESSPNNWMAKSMGEAAEANDAMEDNTKFVPVWSGGQCVPQHDEDMIQGPGTPLPGRSPGGPGRSPMYSSRFRSIRLGRTGNAIVRPTEWIVINYYRIHGDSMDNTGTETAKRKQLSPTPTLYPKSSTPVAYPFTLLKPSETEGDITLKDINQRILMPPSRPLPHVQQHPHQQQALDESSWSLGGCCSPTDSGLGLSGKSIVARTKIHTEGNGMITIMRTRG